MHRLIYGFFFVSGLSSLVFEVIWERMLVDVFGATSFALATLLGVFMGGLALGSYLASHYTGSLKAPLKLYGALEAGIGLYAFLVPLVLDALPWVYNYFFDYFIGNYYLFSLLRAVLAILVLLIPTTCMGATLPIVSQWIARHKRLFQGPIGWLYGINTFGACIGSLAAGFALLPTLGLSATNGAFGLLNIVFGTAVYLAAGSISEAASAAREPETGDDEILDELGDMTGTPTADYDLPQKTLYLVLAVFAISGAVSMAYQVLWRRAYVIVLGSSTYSFTIILTSVLFGIAAGSAIVSPFVKRIQRPVLWFSVTQFGVALSALLSFFVLDHIPRWLFSKFQEQIHSVWQIYTYEFFLVGVVVLIPMILQGMSFPLVIRGIVRRRGSSGQKVGRVYAFNTAGAIAGSLLAGFALMPWLGLQTSISVVILINLVTAAALGARHLFDHWDRTAAFGLAALAAFTSIAFMLAPPLDPVALTRGMFRTYWAREVYSEDSFEEDQPDLVFHEDGLTATVTVEKRKEMTTLKANGKPEASDGADMATQIQVGLLPFIVRAQYSDISPGGEKAAMIGFGSGVTAGASLQWPLKHLDVIEIERAMVGASKHFNHVNNRPLRDDRMDLIISDGKNYLQYTDNKYDVIVSEPSNPWIAGVSALFTVNHFRQIKRHLAKDGVFAQWVQLYELRPVNVRRIIATYLKVFPRVQAFTSKPKGTDMILVGSRRPVEFPPSGYETAWNIESVRKELERAGLHNPHQLLGRVFMNETKLHEFAEGARLNTFDNGLLEYSAPKDLIVYTKGEQFFEETYYDRAVYGDIRPFLAGWPPELSAPEAPWTRANIGHTIRAVWEGGKSDYARQLLNEIDSSVPSELGTLTRPLEPLEQVRAVLNLENRQLNDVVQDFWPRPNSEYHKLIRQSISRGNVPQLRQYLETEHPKDDFGYKGELGLIYAFSLLVNDYDFYAREQLLMLRDEAPPGSRIVRSVPFHFMLGMASWRKSKYRESFDAYRRAALKILSE